MAQTLSTPKIIDKRNRFRRIQYLQIPSFF